MKEKMKENRHLLRKTLLLLCFIGVSLMTAANASAIPISFDIGIPNAALVPYEGPYAKVTVDWVDSMHATITFDSYLLSDGAAYNYLMGDGGIAAVNVNGTFSLVSGSVTGSNEFTNPYFNTPSISDDGTKNVSDFGSFNQAFKGFDGYSHTATQVTFSLVATSGNTWSDAWDVLTPNSEGYLAAAHIYVWDGTTVANGDPSPAVITGFAANGTPVPEPATLLLFGAGLVGVAGLTRKRFKK